jgi:thioredoxin reductase (NADPH)
MPTLPPPDVEETPDFDGAYPRFSPQQIESLGRHGERRAVKAGDVLFSEGDERYDFHVVLEGKVAIIQAWGEPDERLIAVHGPGRFLGELSLLTGQPAFFTAVVVQDGEVLVVPVERLRRLVTQDPALGDLVLRAYLLRREILIGMRAGLRIVGSRHDPDTLRLREFCARNRLPHRWIDLADDSDAMQLLRDMGVSTDDAPVVIWHGQVLRNPTVADLARAVGLRDPGVGSATYDIVVVGAGPSGLAASVYGASEGLATVTLDAVATGGQAATSSKIENYLGFPAGISGAELAERATIQARKFGARITVPGEAVGLDRRDGRFAVRLADAQEVEARTVVIATGARYRKLRVPRLEEFEGNGIYYAATLMEAQMCIGDPVAVVGGGNSAGQATVFLARNVPKVWLIIRGDDLRKDMSAYLADRVERLPNVEILLHTEVRELIGDERLEAIIVEDTRTGERRRLDIRDLFVFLGADPHTGWLQGQVALDDKGFVLTGPAAAERNGGARRDRPPLLLETSLPGVLAVGDVRSGSVKRVASAVGEGSMAVRLVHEHLAERDDSTHNGGMCAAIVEAPGATVGAQVSRA